MNPCAHLIKEDLLMRFDAKEAIEEALESTENLKWTMVLLLAKVDVVDDAGRDTCPSFGDAMIVLDQFCRLEALLTMVKEHYEKTRVNMPRK